MKGYSGAVSEALKALTDAAVTADQKLMTVNLDRITALVAQGDKKALTAFFAADPEGVNLFLTRGIQPATFAGKRFVLLLDSLNKLLDVMYAGEVAQIESFLSTASLTPAQKAKVYTKSLFMSPGIKNKFLAEWVNQPYKGHKLSERIWSLNEESQQSLLKLIAANFADGKNPNAIKPLVRKVTGVDNKNNLRRLLLTENSRTWHGVQQAAVAEFKHIKYVELNYGNRHKRDCACSAWKKKGRIPYDEAPAMPIHPNSSSYLQPVPTPVDEWKKDNGFT